MCEVRLNKLNIILAARGTVADTGFKKCYRLFRGDKTIERDFLLSETLSASIMTDSVAHE